MTGARKTRTTLDGQLVSYWEREAARFDQVIVAGEALGADVGEACAAARTLASDCAGVTALLISPEPALLAALAAAGVDRTLVRPVSGQALLAALHDVVNAPQARAPTPESAAA